jgi:glycosyltransferase involved in cell wall biosynthesis
MCPRSDDTDMRILMPERIVDRHVGGNTTYARHIEAGLIERGISVGRIRSWSRPQLTLLQESITGVSPGSRGDVLHYVADTGPLIRTRRPSVVTVHGVASRWISTARTPKQEKQWRARVRRAISSTDHVITVSDSSSLDIQEVFNIPAERITTIPHGIDVDRFALPRRISPELAAVLPERFALYLGNIEPRKNLVPLVEAFSSKAVVDREIPLVIAGKAAWNSEETLRAISSSDNVIQLGFVSDGDRAALMQHCEMFVFPSLYEGFGFPVVEALAAGAIVVSSNRGALAEVAGPALLFEDITREGIEAGVLAALDDQSGRDRCRQQGQSWARNFHWSESVDKHVSVYRRVLSR